MRLPSAKPRSLLVPIFAFFSFLIHPAYTDCLDMPSLVIDFGFIDYTERRESSLCFYEIPYPLLLHTQTGISFLVLLLFLLLNFERIDFGSVKGIGQ